MRLVCSVFSVGIILLDDELNYNIKLRFKSGNYADELSAFNAKPSLININLQNSFNVISFITNISNKFFLSVNEKSSNLTLSFYQSSNFYYVYLIPADADNSSF
jgi:hypothetical protein